MFGDDKFSSRYFCDSSHLIGFILNSGATCHMTPQVSDFILGSLEDTDKYIGVADGHHIIAMQKGKFQIKLCNNSGDTFIATFHNVLLAPDLY